MKRIIYLFVICLMFSVNIFGQDVSIEWGEEIKNTTNSEILNFIGQNDSCFFHTRIDFNYWKNNEIYLSSNYRSTMKEMYTTKLLIPSGQLTENKDFYFISCFMWNNKIYVLTSVYFKKEDTKIAVIFEVDPNTGFLSESYTEIDKIENIKSIKTANFTFKFSKDKSKMLISSIMGSEDEGDPRLYSISVFEANFKLLYKKSFKIEQKGVDFRLPASLVDNNGNFYQLINAVNLKVEEKKKPAYHYLIQAYYYKGDSIKTFDIDLGDKFICNTKIDVSDEGKLVCAGTYSVNNKNSGVGGEPKYNYSLGIFYTSLDPSNGLLKPIECLNYDSTFKSIQKNDLQGIWLYKDGEVFGILPREILFDNDGSFKLIVEQSFVERVSFTGNSSSSSYTAFNDNIITVFSFDKSSKLIWNQNVLKRQCTQNDNAYFSSFTDFTLNNKLYVIYNEHKYNLGLLQGKKRVEMRLVKEATLMISKIDKEGKQKADELYNTSNLEFYARPRLSKMNKDGEIFIYAQQIRGHYLFGKLTIK